MFTAYYNVWIILQKELAAFFSSLMAYVIVGFFLLLMGLLVWVLPGTNVLEGGYADLGPFFHFGPYVFIFLVPAITMPAVAEERRGGTLEVLLTAPVSVVQIVLGKYLASVVVALLMLLLTGGYYFSIYHLSSPPGNVDTAAVLGAYLGLLLLAAVFAAGGVLTSALTERQLVAFLLGVLLCFFLYQGFAVWAALQSWQGYSLWLVRLSAHHHYEVLSRGVIDSRALLYFGSVVGLLLTAAGLAVPPR